jgi:hypothetical protein
MSPRTCNLGLNCTECDGCNRTPVPIALGGGGCNGGGVLSATKYMGLVFTMGIHESEYSKDGHAPLLRSDDLPTMPPSEHLLSPKLRRLLEEIR